ncbi:type IV secretion system protein [Pelosinus propionicus]|uniref:P-type conjugative transfer protein TrbL n=1 Tax=Pelosinus propionicus DSM 13327 TaxID=1123291 RepID=A0A1I4QF58_9FIRM|nr:type IV secretion system protein [Pelosinus propionicus]SFM38280.1 P-type conjugative transfer protein TrbL [Pelosinus propionicus DSM 13327]
MVDFASETALTDLMKLFIDKCIAGSEIIIPMALGLLGVLACIELALLFLYNAMDGGEDPIFLLVKGLIKYSFFGWLIQNWATGMRFTKQIFDWFSLLGAKAAGSAKVISDPAHIGDVGVTLALSIYDSTLGLGIGSIGIILLKLFMMAIIFLIFAVMAIYIFYTTMQFYVLCTITTAMLPFGANKYTSFLAQPAFGAICNISIKMMFLQFALCVSATYIDTLANNNPFLANSTTAGMLYTIVGSLGMVVFCVGIPQLAGNYFSGSPTFGDGAAGAAGSAVQSAAGAAVSAPVQAAKMGMQAAGIVQAAANIPGGRSPGGKMDLAGTARNMGTMARQSMPDRQMQMHGKSLFNASRSLEKDRTNVEAQKNQTNLF